MTDIPESASEPALASERTAESGGFSHERLLRIVIPLVMLAALVGLWAWYVKAYNVPKYILPGPDLVAESLWNDWGTLGPALFVTLTITFQALAIALVGGVLIAILFASSRWVEVALSPYMVILQVTPIVAIAPLILIYTSTTQQALLILRLDRRLLPGPLQHDAGAEEHGPQPAQPLRALWPPRAWQTLFLLKLPAALPYFLASVSASPAASR